MTVRNDARRLEQLLGDVSTAFAEVWPDAAGQEFRRLRVQPIKQLVDRYCLEAVRFDREMREALDRIP